MLDLAVAVFSYASDFFGSDDRPRDLPEVKRVESIWNYEKKISNFKIKSHEI